MHTGLHALDFVGPFIHTLALFVAMHADVANAAQKDIIAVASNNSYNEVERL
jgi:hypothetical protein